MRLSQLAIAALALSSIGCLDGLDQPDGKAGFITVDVLSTGGPGYAVRPFGVFYDDTNLHFDPPAAGRCSLLPYSDTDPQFNSGKTMDVGERIVTTLPAGSDELLPTTEFEFTFYRATNPGGIAIVPGDVMSFAITGGEGFPAATIADAVPETFTYADVLVPVEAAPIALSWTPPSVEGSVINFSLRFADDFSEGLENRQISCWFEDTGAAEVPRSYSDSWIRAKDDVRSVSATRLRSKVVQIAEDVDLTIVSTLSVPTDPITP